MGPAGELEPSSTRTVLLAALGPKMKTSPGAEGRLVQDRRREAAGRAGQGRRHLPRPEDVTGPFLGPLTKTGAGRTLDVRASAATGGFTTADARRPSGSPSGCPRSPRTSPTPPTATTTWAAPPSSSTARCSSPARRSASTTPSASARPRTGSPRASSSAMACSRRTSAAVSARSRRRPSTPRSSRASRTSSTSRTRSTSTATPSAARPPSPGPSADLKFKNTTPYGVLHPGLGRPQLARRGRAR